MSICQYEPSISTSLDPIRSIWLENNLQQTCVWSKLSPHGYKHLTQGFFYTGQQAFLPQRDRCLNVNVDYLEVWNVEASWNVMADAQKPDFVFGRNRRVHSDQWGRQFSQLLAVEVCASAVVMLDTPRTEVVWRVQATHSIHQFPLHFPSQVSPCAITFQLESAICHPCAVYM